MMERKKGATLRATWTTKGDLANEGAINATFNNDHTERITVFTQQRGNRVFTTYDDGWISVKRRAKPSMVTGQFNLRAAKSIKNRKTDSTKKSIDWKSQNKKFFSERGKRRCFKCLSSTHLRFQCRDPVRCFYCNKLGHSSLNCSAKSDLAPPIKSSKKELTETSIEKGNISIAIMEGSMTSFVKGPLPHHLQFLHKSAYVTVITRNFREGLRDEIIASLIETYGGNEEDYRLHKAGQPADFILICRNQQMRNYIAVPDNYILDDNTTLLFEPWTKHWGAARRPNRFRCYLRLTWPFHHMWNRSDIEKIVSGFGILHNVYSMFPPLGDHRHLRLSVDCERPNLVPQYLWLKYEDYAREVRVYLRYYRDRTAGHNNFFLHGAGGHQAVHGQGQNGDVNSDNGVQQAEGENDDQSDGTETDGTQGRNDDDVRDCDDAMAGVIIRGEGGKKMMWIQKIRKTKQVWMKKQVQSMEIVTVPNLGEGEATGQIQFEKEMEVTKMGGEMEGSVLISNGGISSFPEEPIETTDFEFQNKRGCSFRGEGIDPVFSLRTLKDSLPHFSQHVPLTEEMMGPDYLLKENKFGPDFISQEEGPDSANGSIVANKIADLTGIQSLLNTGTRRRSERLFRKENATYISSIEKAHNT